MPSDRDVGGQGDEGTEQGAFAQLHPVHDHDIVRVDRPGLDVVSVAAVRQFLSYGAVGDCQGDIAAAGGQGKKLRIRNYSMSVHPVRAGRVVRSEEHTSELQSRENLV